MINNMQLDEDHSYNGQSFSVSADERMSLQDLAKLYEESTQSTLDIVWGKRAYREREVMIPWTKGLLVPRWKQKISLKDAISKFINKKEK